MSFTESALRTKEAKEAIGEGILALFSTGNLGRGIDAMFKAGERNGSLNKVRVGFILDILKNIR